MSLALYDRMGATRPVTRRRWPGFDAGVRVRLRASDGTATHALFTGRVESITPYRAVGARGKVAAARGCAAWTTWSAGACPSALSRCCSTPGVLVERLITRSVVMVGREAYWWLGHPQAGRLGGLTVPLIPRPADLDAGQSSPWAGTLGGGAARRRSRCATCASEGGRLAIADGTPTFRIATPAPAHPNVAQRGVGGTPRPAWRVLAVANSVEVTVHPRMVGEPGEVLWRAGHAVRLAPARSARWSPLPGPDRACDGGRRVERRVAPARGGLHRDGPG